MWSTGYTKQEARPPLESARPVELAVWRVEFRSSSDLLLAGLGRATERFVLISPKGNLKRFYYPIAIQVKYEPASLDQRRALARQAAELACGPLPADYALQEASGGEREASYNATWGPAVPSLSTRLVQVALVAEKVVEVSCYEQRAALLPAFVVELDAMRARLPKFFGLVRIGLGALLLVLFVLGHCYRLPAVWKRLALALPLGLMSVWLFSPALAASGALTSLSLLLIVGFAAAGLAWIGLLTAEHYLRRWAPEQIASYLLALRLRWAEPAVGLAVLRGALAGLVLAGCETLMVHFSSTLLSLLPREPEELQIFNIFLPGFVDPASVAQAVQSFSPSLFVIAAAIFNGVVIGVILLGVPLGWFSRKLPAYRGKRRFSGWKLFSKVAFWWVLTGLSLHLAEFLPRPFGWFYAALLLALVVAWVVLRYDVLTGVVAIATAVLWKLNFSLLVLLGDLGNAAQWAVFLAWGAVVVLSALVAFRSQLGGLRQRVAAEFQ